jgi:transposase-like protein
MKGKKHSPEQVIRKLREAEVLKGQGQSLGQVCQALGVSEQTYHRWKGEYGSMPGDAMKRLKDLEQENGRLKKAVAELTLDKQILQEALRGKG